MIFMFQVAISHDVKSFLCSCYANCSVLGLGNEIVFGHNVVWFINIDIQILLSYIVQLDFAGTIRVFS